MKLINQRLYVEFDELIAAGVGENTIRTAKKRQSNSWVFIKDPLDARRVLVDYEQLRDKYKELLFDMYGDVYQYSSAMILDSVLVSKEKDRVVIRNYQYSEGKYLPLAYQQRYLDACRYLGLAAGLTVRGAKDLGFGSKKAFNDVLLGLVRLREVGVPKSQRQFYMKVKDYKQNGALCVVSKRFGNDWSRKVGKGSHAAVQMALMQELLGRHQNWDCERIARKYNQEMIRMGLSNMTVTGSLVRGYKKADLVGMAGRIGKRGFKHKVGMLNKRIRPSAPLFYVTVDGWTVELVFQERGVAIRDGKEVNLTKYHHRQVLVVILDPFNNYPLGYAIGDRENVKLIQAAMKNALDHSKELTGQYYSPFQVQSDRYGIKQLTPFYEAITKHFTPAEVGNSNSKVIEPYFNYLNREYAQEYLNWSGHNVDAKKANQPNVEFMQMVKKEFPGKRLNTLQIHEIMHLDRKKKAEKWLRAFNRLESDDKRLMDRMEYLECVGTVAKKTSKMRAAGFDLTVDGETYSYDTFEKSFRYLHHLDWEVRYDLVDRSSILVLGEGGKYKYLLESKEIMSMALKDRKEGNNEGEYLKRVRDFNKGLIEEITEQRAENMELLDLYGVEAHKQRLMLTPSDGQQKEMIQDGKGLIDRGEAATVPKKKRKRVPKVKPKVQSKEDIKRNAVRNI